MLFDMDRNPWKLTLQGIMSEYSKMMFFVDTPMNTFSRKLNKKKRKPTPLLRVHMVEGGKMRET